MRIFEELFRKSKDEVVISVAVQSWTLLLSIAPEHIIPVLFTRYVRYTGTLSNYSLGLGPSSLASSFATPPQ